MRIDRDHATLIAGALVSLALMGVFERVAPWARPDTVHAVGAASEARERASRAPQAPRVPHAAAESHAPHASHASKASNASQATGPAPAASARALRAAEVDRLSAHIAAKWRIGRPQAQRIVRAASTQAQQQRLSPTLVLAIVARESSFRPDARSRYGAQGLMQVVPRHHPEKVPRAGHAALLAPEVNIEIGTRVLAEYLARGDGRLDAALVKYSGNAPEYPADVRRLWREFESVRKSVRVEL